jgi:galactose mutarotase-like enzyme
VEIYKLTNAHGVEASFITYGATLVSLKAPDRSGKLANIVLGFDSLDKYVAAGVPYYGATVGRYANRIAKARFTLDGKTYQLEANDGPNTLHGGKRGFDKRVWKAEEIPAAQGGGVRMTLVSADGDGGYPGEVTAQVVYKLDDQDNLEIDYHATTTAPTPINLANHAYFNLTGDPANTVLDHLVTIHADRFTPVDATLIPTGELRPVAGTRSTFARRTPSVPASAPMTNNCGWAGATTTTGYSTIQVAKCSWRRVSPSPRVGALSRSALHNPACSSTPVTSWTVNRRVSVVCMHTAPGCVSRHNTSRILPTIRLFRPPYCAPARSIRRRRSCPFGS